MITYHEASNDCNSIPRCSIGLNLNVRGNGTLAIERQNDGREEYHPMFITDIIVKCSDTHLLGILKTPN